MIALMSSCSWVRGPGLVYRRTMPYKAHCRMTCQGLLIVEPPVTLFLAKYRGHLEEQDPPTS